MKEDQPAPAGSLAGWIVVRKGSRKPAMKFGFTKDESKRRDEIADSIEQAVKDYDAARAAYNEAIREAFAKFEDTVRAVNEAREAAHGFFDDIASERRGAFDDRSERWQEGDAGQNAEAWLTQLETVRDALADEIDAEEPEEQGADLDISADSIRDIAPDSDSL